MSKRARLNRILAILFIIWGVAVVAYALSDGLPTGETAHGRGQLGAFVFGLVVAAVGVGTLVGLRKRFAYEESEDTRGGRRGRLALAVFALLAIGAAAVAAGRLDLPSVPSPEAAMLDDCLSEGGAGFRSALRQALTPEQLRLVGNEEIDAIIRDFCEEAVTEPGASSMSDETAGPFVSRMFKEHPARYERICRPFVAADFAANAVFVRHMTTQERRRYKRDACRLPLDYMSDDSARIDYTALINDHPGFLAPMCASGVREGFARNAEVNRRFDDDQLDRIARRSCLRAIKNGAIDVSGAQGLLDARFDDRLLAKVIAQEARREARA